MQFSRQTNVPLGLYARCWQRWLSRTASCAGGRPRAAGAVLRMSPQALEVVPTEALHRMDWPPSWPRPIRSAKLSSGHRKRTPVFFFFLVVGWGAVFCSCAGCTLPDGSASPGHLGERLLLPAKGRLCCPGLRNVQSRTGESSPKVCASGEPRCITKARAVHGKAAPWETLSFPFPPPGGLSGGPAALSGETSESETARSAAPLAPHEQG